MNIKASKIRSWRLVVSFATLLIWIFAQGIHEVYSQELLPVPFEGELKKPWKITYDIDSHKIIIDFSPLKSFKSLEHKVTRDINKFIKRRETALESYSLKEINLQLNSSEQSSEGAGNNYWKISYSGDDLNAAGLGSLDFTRLDKIIIPHERFDDLQKVETVSIELAIELNFPSQGKDGNYRITSIYTHQVGSDIKEALQDQIINDSHQTLYLHNLDTSSSFDGERHRRHLMPILIPMAGLAFEAATVAVTTLESLTILLAGLKSLQSHICNNVDPYEFNQEEKEVCKSLSGNSINVYQDIIERYTTVAKWFHKDPNSTLRMIETDDQIYIYLPNGHNIALHRDVENDGELGEEYKTFKTYFKEIASTVCNKKVAGRQCAVFTYNKEVTLDEAYKKVNPLILKAHILDSRIVSYHKDSLICDKELLETHGRLLMYKDNECGPPPPNFSEQEQKILDSSGELDIDSNISSDENLSGSGPVFYIFEYHQNPSAQSDAKLVFHFAPHTTCSPPEDCLETSDVEILEFDCLDEDTVIRKRQLEGKDVDNFSDFPEPPDEFKGFYCPSNNVFKGFYFKDITTLSSAERNLLGINRRNGGVIVTRLIGHSYSAEADPSKFEINRLQDEYTVSGLSDDQSSSEQGRLLQNDIIVAIGGKPIVSKKDVSNIFKHYKVGNTLELIVIRGSDTQQVTIPVKLAEKVWCGRNKSKAVKLIRECYQDRPKASRFNMSPQKYVCDSDVEFAPFEDANTNVDANANANKNDKPKIVENAKKTAPAEKKQPRTFCQRLCQCLGW